MSEISSDQPAPADPIPPPVAPPDPNLICTLSDGTLVKQRLARMRACNQKDAKGKICAGHLKRWFRYGPEVSARFGAGAEIYRCEKCLTLYLPHPADPRTGTLSY
ncbi:MAG: hypothetical protein U5J83_00930 [Bryobacterales bacterium]|nr:hypothetical protein [Bryobacterales bacterium]